MIRQRQLLLASVLLGAFLLTHSANAVSPPGPDAFGHTIAPIAYALRGVSLTGDDIGLDLTDDQTVVVPIGFDFSFYGNSYEELEVSSNGFVSFDLTGESACCSGEPIPTVGGQINNFIAGYWEDLAPVTGGVIRTQTLGAVGSREFVVGFYAVADLDDPDNSINTFEIILHEGTNNIELQYDQVQFENVDNKTAGIENADGTDGIELLFIESTAPLANGDLLFEREGYLISVVPEPSTAFLAFLGLAVWATKRQP